MHVLIKKWWFQMVLGLLLTLLLVWHPIINQPVQAQLDTSTSFRLSRIETDIRNLQSEIRQIETALSRVERSSGDTVIVHEIGSEQGPFGNSSSAQPFPESPDPLDIEATQSELMFDQLATLVIETRQDMFELQEKVANLEQTHQLRADP